MGSQHDLMSWNLLSTAGKYYHQQASSSTTVHDWACNVSESDMR